MTDSFNRAGWRWDFANPFPGGQLPITDGPMILECLECGCVLTVGKDDPPLEVGDSRLCEHMEVITRIEPAD